MFSSVGSASMVLYGRLVKRPEKEGGAEAGDLPRNRFIVTGTLFGCRSKVEALEKLRILSPGPKKCTDGKHQSDRLAAIFLVPRRARPEG